MHPHDALADPLPFVILGLVSLGSLYKESDSTSKASARKNRNDVDPA